MWVTRHVRGSHSSNLMEQSSNRGRDGLKNSLKICGSLATCETSFTSHSSNLMEQSIIEDAMRGSHLLIQPDGAINHRGRDGLKNCSLKMQRMSHHFDTGHHRQWPLRRSASTAVIGERYLSSLFTQQLCKYRLNSQCTYIVLLNECEESLKICMQLDNP